MPILWDAEYSNLQRFFLKKSLTCFTLISILENSLGFFMNEEVFAEKMQFIKIYNSINNRFTGRLKEKENDRFPRALDKDCQLLKKYSWAYYIFSCCTIRIFSFFK